MFVNRNNQIYNPDIMKTNIIIFLLMSCIFICPDTSAGQIPSYRLFAENFIPNGDYYTANEFTFDIKIRKVNNTRLEYAGGQFTLDFRTDVANGGTLSFDFTSDTSDLPAELRPQNPHIIYGSSISKMVLDLNNFPEPGNGYLIPLDSGTTIAKLKMRTTAPTFSFTGWVIGGWWLIDLYAQWNVPLTKVYAIIDSAVVDVPAFDMYVQYDGLAVNPVELSGFTSNVQENNVALYWTTSAEINNYGFDIERRNNNRYWTKAGFVKGNGTINELKNYTFTERLNTGKYHYRLKQVDYNGNFEYFDLADEVSVGLPQKYELSQNYPNPFNPSTKINYSIPYSEFVSLKVYDINGREVSSLVNEIQIGGYYAISFNASDLPGGVYFYSLTTNSFTNARRMVLIK